MMIDTNGQQCKDRDRFIDIMDLKQSGMCNRLHAAKCSHSEASVQPMRRDHRKYEQSELRQDFRIADQKMIALPSASAFSSRDDAVGSFGEILIHIIVSLVIVIIFGQWFGYHVIRQKLRVKGRHHSRSDDNAQRRDCVSVASASSACQLPSSCTETASSENKQSGWESEFIDDDIHVGNKENDDFIERISSEVWMGKQRMSLRHKQKPTQVN